MYKWEWKSQYDNCLKFLDSQEKHSRRSLKHVMGTIMHSVMYEFEKDITSQVYNVISTQKLFGILKVSAKN